MSEPLPRRGILKGLAVGLASVVLPRTPEAFAAAYKRKPPRSGTGFGSSAFGSKAFGA